MMILKDGGDLKWVVVLIGGLALMGAEIRSPANERRARCPDLAAGSCRTRRVFRSTEFIHAVQVFRGVRMLSHRMNEASADWLAPHDITVAQYNFLAALFQHDRDIGLSSRDIGKYMHTTSGTVTSMTHTLEREGLVKRTEHSTDRRSIMVKLTPKGRRRFVAAAERTMPASSRPSAGSRRRRSGR